MKTRMMTIVAVIAVIAVGLLVAFGSVSPIEGSVGLCALGMAAVLPGVKDALVKETKALPNGAATIYSDGLDTDVSANGVQPKEVEYLLTAPALATADLGDAATMKYSIITDTVKPLDAASTVLMPDVIVQTGAGGAGAAAATYRFRLPANAGRILGFKAVNSAAGDASDKSATLEALF